VAVWRFLSRDWIAHVRRSRLGENLPQPSGKWTGRRFAKATEEDFGCAVSAIRGAFVRVWRAKAY